MKPLRLASVLLLVVAPALLGAMAPAVAVAAAAEAAAPPPSRWIGVSVATLWVRPGEARAIDAPACASPADPRAWVETMSVAQKRWLVGRLETQALYGARVYLLSTSGSWSKVAVAAQPTPRSPWGYPGWVPTRQLVTRAPQAAPRAAVVCRPTAWLWRGPDLSGRVLELSYGTRLPVVGSSAEAVEVATLDGRHLYLRRSSVVLRVADGEQTPPTGDELVREARRFLGLQYLWAGTSGFGLDCSGFTHLVYAAAGVTIPRDGAPQFAQGRKIRSRASLRAGDLVFFRDASRAIHHVGIYAGDGRMIHAPRTGRPVTESSLFSEPYRSEYAGGRRYVP